MRTCSIKSFGEAGIRLFLCVTFTLLLSLCVTEHVDGGCFVAADVPEQHHLEMRSGSAVPPGAELLEEEFDEAVVPKTLHDVLPVLAPPQPFCLEQTAWPPIPRSGGCLTSRGGVFSSTPRVLRC